MNLRTRLVVAYLAAAVVFLAAIQLLRVFDAHWSYFAAAAFVISAGFFGYVTDLKCPNCNAKAFSRRWLAVAYIPKTCASCDRDFADR
ncbi:MAG: hypothetical protein ACHQK9_21280 [Reyranellales bacterium]